MLTFVANWPMIKRIPYVRTAIVHRNGPTEQMPATDTATRDGAHQLVRYAAPSLFGVGMAAVAIGAALLAVPNKGLTSVLIGTYLTLSGIGQLPIAFGTHIGSGKVLALLASDVYIIMGMFCFNKELSTQLLITLWIGVAMVLRGLTWQNATLLDKNMPARGLQGLAGLAVLLSGDLIIGAKPHSFATLALLAGLALIFTGTLEVITAFRIRIL